MSKFVIMHGRLRVGSGSGDEAFQKVGDTVELDDAFVAQVDPLGTTFITEEKYLKLEEIKELQKEIDELSSDEKEEALVETVKAKKSKKQPAAE
jgi:hypothetical protein